MDIFEKIGEAVRAVNRLGAQPATGQEIFNNFDIVVAISQKTINDQLQKLVAMGTIKSRLTLVQVAQNRQFKYLTSAAEIPANAAYIDADIVPQIDIHASGTQLTFILAFKSGKAAFWQGGPGPLAQLTQFDVAGWRYGFAVTLDLTAITSGDAAKRQVTPDSVRRTLQDFQSRLFRSAACSSTSRRAICCASIRPRRRPAPATRPRRRCRCSWNSPSRTSSPRRIRTSWAIPPTRPTVAGCPMA